MHRVKLIAICWIYKDGHEDFPTRPHTTPLRVRLRSLLYAAALADKEKELHEAIAALQKDVQGQKKEIREREETIADKESRIYDLKKKNQVR